MREQRLDNITRETIMYNCRVFAHRLFCQCKIVSMTEQKPSPSTHKINFGRNFYCIRPNASTFQKNPPFKSSRYTTCWLGCEVVLWLGECDNSVKLTTHAEVAGD